jgi:hypothetical protein
VDIPVERGQQPLFTSRTVDPDVQSNERPFDGRVYVMVLDSAHDAGSGAVGSVLYDLDVPDFSKDRLAMSGLVLTSAAASSGMTTARLDNELDMVLPGPPVGVRSFARSDPPAVKCRFGLPHDDSSSIALRGRGNADGTCRPV